MFDFIINIIPSTWRRCWRYVNLCFIWLWTKYQLWLHHKGSLEIEELQIRKINLCEIWIKKFKILDMSLRLRKISVKENLEEGWNIFKISLSYSGNEILSCHISFLRVFKEESSLKILKVRRFNRIFRLEFSKKINLTSSLWNARSRVISDG